MTSVTCSLLKGTLGSNVRTVPFAHHQTALAADCRMCLLRLRRLIASIVVWTVRVQDMLYMCMWRFLKKWFKPTFISRALVLALVLVDVSEIALVLLSGGHNGAQGRHGFFPSIRQRDVGRELRPCRLVRDTCMEALPEETQAGIDVRFRFWRLLLLVWHTFG